MEKTGWRKEFEWNVLYWGLTYVFAYAIMN